MSDTPDEDSLAHLAETDPEEMINMVGRLADEGHLDSDELVGIAKDCAEDGVNLFQVLADHPELTETKVGVDLAEVRRLADTFETAIAEN
jgi:hypothetical protein